MSPEGYQTGKMYEISIEDIILPATQTRQYFDPSAMEELQASIQRHGVLQPVIVTNGEEGKFVLVSGERRYQACVAVSLPPRGRSLRRLSAIRLKKAEFPPAGIRRNLLG